jgi:Na+/melibiose symporter-like transporter
MAFPLAFAGLPVYLHAPDFYASELNVPLAAIGTALLILRFVDAVQDPLIGYYSDRFSAKRGWIVIVGAVLLGLGFWMIFHPKTGSQLGWFSLSVFICTTGFSVVSINIQALGGLWQAAPHQRTLITGWREAIGLVGLLAAAIVPSLLGRADDAEAAFHLLTLIYLPLLLAATISLLGWMGRTRFDEQACATVGGNWASFLMSPWRRLFYGIYFLNALASAIPAVLVIFFIRDRLQAETETGLFLLLYFLSGALGMPIWQYLSGPLGKCRAWGWSILLAILTFSWALFLGPGDREAYAAICVLSGLALGADLALPPSILADHIAVRGHQHYASRYFSVMTLISKASLALATGLILPALGLAGYQPGRIADQQVTVYLSLAYALAPLVVKTAAAVWLWYRLPHLQNLGSAGSDPGLQRRPA